MLARPETEPLGRRLVDQLNGLLDLPVGVACAILFEFQGRARADCELSLLEFLAGRVARWKLGPGRGIDRMDVVRSWSFVVADGLSLRVQCLKRLACVDGPGAVSRGCEIPGAEAAKVYRHGTGSTKRRKFSEPRDF